jgi:hypothetical protein
VGSVGIGFFSYVFLATRWGESSILTVLSLGLVMLLYAILVCLVGAVRASDVLSMPLGRYLYRFFTRLHLIREEPSEINYKDGLN